MYNLHTHSLISDGVLLPSELAVRFLAAGYKTIAITDHADYSNIDLVIKSTLNFIKHWPASIKINILPGIELTHLPLEQFKPLSKYARGKGIKVIVAHGETQVEPVLKGTNRAALQADIDILAHPGLIKDDEVKLAAKKGIFLEITSRMGHCKSNQHVVKKALKFGAKLILGIDYHSPEDIISPAQLRSVGLGAKLTNQQINDIYKNTQSFIKLKGGR